MSRRLEVHACRGECAWAQRDELLDGQPLFACTGCGSEWVGTEVWTPADRRGVVPEAVQRERERRGRG